MWQTVFIEIALQIQEDLHNALQTRLPYPWDFCRTYFTQDIRLMLNSASYFIVYAAFIFSFVSYSLKELKNISGNKLTPKNWCLAILFTTITATQVLWPVFLAVTYFLTCSFYPMASAAVVLYMNFPNFTPCRLFRLSVSKSAELLSAYGPSLRISLDGVHLEDVDLSDMFTYPVERRVLSEGSPSETSLPYSPQASFESESSELSERSSLVLPHIESELRSHEYAGSSNEQFPLSPFTSQSDETRFQHTVERSFEDISQSDYNFKLSKTMTLGDSRSTETVESTEIEHITLPKIIANAGLMTDMEEGDIISDKWSKEMSQKDMFRKESSPRHPEKAATWAYGTRDRKGYCGRCWRGNNLPFKPGFSKLREPYVTRSGQIYGPTSRFLTITEYIEQYGL